MNRVDKDVLARIATEIMSAPTVEEQLKKVNTDKDFQAKYYLAELLGMTVKDLEENMSLSEYTGWLAYLEHKHN